MGRARSLERQPQGELQRSRPAFLKKRVEAAETLVRHLLRAEIDGTELDIGRGIREVRMIEEVERVGAKLQLQAFGQREAAFERQIDLRESEAGNVVSPFGPLAWRGWDNKGVGIEALSSSRRGIRNPKRLSRDKIGSGKSVAAWIGRVQKDLSIEGKAVSGDDD